MQFSTVLILCLSISAQTTTAGKIRAQFTSALYWAKIDTLPMIVQMQNVQKILAIRISACLIRIKFLLKRIFNCILDYPKSA